jgi:lipoprotein-anchoring transpeptidase ErfK/SrfK
MRHASQHTEKSYNHRLVAALLAMIMIASTAAGAALAAATTTYRVQSGDTLAGLANRFGISVVDLAAANGLQWNSWIYTGQDLVIPGSAGDQPPTAPQPGSEPGPDPLVPDPLPELPILPLEKPATVVALTYARVIKPDVAVYASPEDAARDLAPKRNLGRGYLWVSVEEETLFEGESYIRINVGEYVHADALAVYDPSRFQGVALAAQPERPFAWILRTVRPTVTPAGAVNPDAPAYGRYQLVQIYATEYLGDQVWYLIGPHQWINQIYVGKVELASRPAGIDAGAAWVDVNLFEQTIAVYVGDQMIYATLIASGLPGWDTPVGLFQVWHRVPLGKMSGSAGRSDYYFLEDVPWSLYFNQAVAFHTAYWHDDFGYKHSHGCVNLAPLDARWLFDWAPELLQVWVH